MNSARTESRLIRFATRSSSLARWQTQFVADALQTVWGDLSVQIQVMDTRGDRLLDQPLPDIGGKGLFTAELDRALLADDVDVVVHSLKDLPTEEDGALSIAAIPRRAPAHDVLLSRDGAHLADLPAGAVVGTSSLRRSAQVLARRPDLQVAPIRGNVETRIKKMLRGDFAAIVLAAAGVQRLVLEHHISEHISSEDMLPAPGQGALAVQCRRSDQRMRTWLASIEHASTRRRVEAERAFLAALGGGCSLPVGALAEVVDTDQLRLSGRVMSTDGRRRIDVSGQGADPAALGRALADEALAQGAAELLDG
jgi:hydroxymethylbilane synthase